MQPLCVSGVVAVCVLGWTAALSRAQCSSWNHRRNCHARDGRGLDGPPEPLLSSSASMSSAFGARKANCEALKGNSDLSCFFNGRFMVLCAPGTSLTPTWFSQKV